MLIENAVTGQIPTGTPGGKSAVLIHREMALIFFNGTKTIQGRDGAGERSGIPVYMVSLHLMPENSIVGKKSQGFGAHRSRCFKADAHIRKFGPDDIRLFNEPLAVFHDDSAFSDDDQRNMLFGKGPYPRT